MQIDFLNFFIRNKNVFFVYESYREKNLKINRRLQDILLNYRVWKNIENLSEIMKFIHEIQKMSKSNRTHFDYVIRRWNKIYDHLKNLMIKFDYSHVDKIRTIFEFRLNDKNQKIRIWHDRYIKQIIDFHHATFHLNFVNQHIQMTQSEQIVVLRFMKKYIDEAKVFKQIRKQFFYMKFQQHDWTSSNDIWIEKKSEIVLIHDHDYIWNHKFFSID